MTEAIALWNTEYLERAMHAMHTKGISVDAVLLPYLSPLGWEHVNLTGGYVRRQDRQRQAGEFRPLRPLQKIQPLTSA